MTTTVAVLKIDSVLRSVLRMRGHQNELGGEEANELHDKELQTFFTSGSPDRKMSADRVRESKRSRHDPTTFLRSGTKDDKRSQGVVFTMNPLTVHALQLRTPKRMHPPVEVLVRVKSRQNPGDSYALPDGKDNTNKDDFCTLMDEIIF